MSTTDQAAVPDDDDDSEHYDGPMPSRGAFIAAARAQYDSDTISIDDNATLSEYDEGAWVLAWLNVSTKKAAGYEGSKEAIEANGTKPFLGFDVQQQVVAALAAARIELDDANDSGHNYNEPLVQRIDAALAAAGAPAATEPAKPIKLAIVFGQEDTRAVEEDGRPMSELPTYEVIEFATEREQTAYLAGLSDGLGIEEYHAEPAPTEGAKP